MREPKVEDIEPVLRSSPFEAVVLVPRQTKERVASRLALRKRRKGARRSRGQGGSK